MLHKCIAIIYTESRIAFSRHMKVYSLYVPLCTCYWKHLV